jgi:hypothetical protein
MRRQLQLSSWVYCLDLDREKIDKGQCCSRRGDEELKRSFDPLRSFWDPSFSKRGVYLGRSQLANILLRSRSSDRGIE